MQEYTIQDADGRHVRFIGELLGSASTKERDSLRWSETNIYRTKGGKYILQKIGRTTLYHKIDGCKYGTTMPSFNAAPLSAEGRYPIPPTPCPVCKPGPLLFQNHLVRVESNRYTVHDSDTPEGILESARTTDDDGATYMTRVCREAIEQACETDQKLRDAYMVRVVE